jgi:hypothetical protein
MAVEVKLRGKPQDQRVADRLRGSSEGNNADQTFSHGAGPTRTITSLYHSAGVSAHRESGGLDVNDKQALIDEYHRRKASGEA